MTETGLARRWRPRGIARVAVIVMVLAATCIAAGAGATAARHAAAVSRVSLAYICAFPAGPRPVSVLAQATFPTAGTAGQPIQPIAAGVTVTLPAPAVASLARLRAAKVSAVARLSTVVTERGRSVPMVWAGLAAPEAQLPAKGSLAFTASGPVPPVTVAVPGGVTFTAAGLSLVFTPRPASNATEPMGLQVRCTVRPGQDAALAALPVSGATEATVPQRSGPARTTGSGTNFCPKLKKALKFNPRFPLPKPPPGSHVLHSTGLPPYCVYAAGYSDVLKLKGSAFLGPGLSNVSPFLNSIFDFNPPKINYFQQDSAAELSFHGQREFPPAKATFLTFGFVPATATMHLMEQGTMNIVTLGAAAPTQCQHPCPTITTVYSRLFLRIDGVTVNGVPLAVGPNCQTPGFDVILKGSSATNPPYSFTAGGPLTGTVKIPHFAGCGVGENVDAIFNSSISGPGNFTLLTQGVVCQQGPSPLGCPPKKPKPLRNVTG